MQKNLLSVFIKFFLGIFIITFFSSCTTTTEQNDKTTEKIQPKIIEGVVEEKEEVPDTSWYRICLWPNVSYPTIYEVPDVYGISFGLTTFGTEGKVEGLDIGAGAISDYVHGAKIALVTKGKETKGFVGGVFNIDKEVNGVQIGLGNEVEYMEWGCQIGLVNEAKKHSEGYQVGLINLMKNGYFEVMPFFNFPKEEKVTETKKDEKYDDQAW